MLKFPVLNHQSACLFTISTILVGIWSLIQIYNNIVKSKQKLGVKFESTQIDNSDKNLEFFIKCEPNNKSELFVEYISPNFSDGFKEKDCFKSLNVYEFEFKNIGKNIINGSDFFPAERLGLKTTFSFALCAIINSKTPQYINANIEINNKNIIINFDTIKSGDSIYILL